VLFNRACDYSMKSAGLDGEQKEKLQQLALRDLKESITRSPENASEADSDPDFAPYETVRTSSHSSGANLLLFLLNSHDSIVAWATSPG